MRLKPGLFNCPFVQLTRDAPTSAEVMGPFQTERKADVGCRAGHPLV